MWDRLCSSAISTKPLLLPCSTGDKAKVNYSAFEWQLFAVVVAAIHISTLCKRGGVSLCLQTTSMWSVPYTGRLIRGQLGSSIDVHNRRWIDGSIPLLSINAID
jgi:hypothetical protein